MPIANLPSLDLFYLQHLYKGESKKFSDLILIHGLAANLAFWHLGGVASELSTACRVTAYDIRGHGHSQVTSTGYVLERVTEDLRELMDFFSIDTAHLLGHSYGGLIALLFAIRYPHRVSSLILADVRLRLIQPRLRIKDFKQWPVWKKEFINAGIIVDENDPEGGYQLLVTLARMDLQVQRNRTIPLFSGFNSHGKRKSKVAKHWLWMQQNTSLPQDFLRPENISRRDLRRLKMPVLALYGEYSQALQTARAIKRLCPNCQLRIIPKAGHFFPIVQSEKLVCPCLGFFAVQRRELNSGQP